MRNRKKYSMNMQEPFSELMRVGKIEGAERRLLNHLRNSGEEGKSIKEVAKNGTERDLRYRFEDSCDEGESHGGV
jgi:hypothetical protein